MMRFRDLRSRRRQVWLGGRTAIGCAVAASQNKPFCDGSMLARAFRKVVGPRTAARRQHLIVIETVGGRAVPDLLHLAKAV